MTSSTRPEAALSIDDHAGLRRWIEAVLDEPVSDITVTLLLSTDSASGVPLVRITFTTGATSRSLVAKIASPNSDWIARATDDSTVREAQLARVGLGSRLPPSIVWPVLDTCPTTDGGWLILMTDLATSDDSHLVPSGDDVVSAAETTTHLTNLAALHRAFAGDAGSIAEVALCTIRDWTLLLGPETIERERGHNDPETPHLARGWETFRAHTPKAFGDAITDLLADPAPLVKTLTSLPSTLLHGDFKFANLGMRHGDNPATMALDWSQAMSGPPALDLVCFLAVNSARLPFSKEQAIVIYRAALGVEDDSEWRRGLDLALLAGGVMRLGWAKALGAVANDSRVAEREMRELNWWVTVGERALRHLDVSR